MFTIDNYLQKLEDEKRPIRVGLVGTGFAGKGFMLQMITAGLGMRLAAVANRTLSYAEQGYRDAGVSDIIEAKDQTQLDQAIKAKQAVITSNWQLLTDSDQVDVIVEATGEVEFGSRVVTRAIDNKKHVVLINVELDATLGPIMKVKADQAGVVYTQADGDQPGVLMNLYRRVKYLGFRPVMAGNIKGMIDCRRTPDTQREFAEKHWQRPKMITSFADGTKICIEMATIANGTGFKVGKRGMYGPACNHVDEAYKFFSMEQLMNGGLVDYILGAQPSFGIFILGYNDHPIKQRYMNMYKMGDGPIYTFYTHTHLAPIEVPLSVARAVIFKDPTLVPLGAPVTEVITLAKKNLLAGETLDGIGGFTCYGAIDNADISRQQNLLPIGLSDGCKLKRDIAIDQAIIFEDVELPSNRLSDQLWHEQEKYFKSNFIYV